MENTTVLSRRLFTGERALFGSKKLSITDSVFENGESPLKESKDISLDTCLFRWKYPLWYCKHIDVKNCTWFDMARAGVWHTDDITVCDSSIEAPKNFRRCDGLTLKKRDLFQCCGNAVALQKRKHGKCRRTRRLFCHG